jgi:TonB family protein
MKFILVLIIVAFFSGCTSSGVSNLNAVFEHGDCMVRYTLEGSKPAGVTLFLSFDNDHTWSKVVDDVSGDIGENVTPGEKVIVVHNMPIDGLANARFRIIVNNKETIETAVVGNIGEANATSENPHYNQPFEDDNAHYDQEELPMSRHSGGLADERINSVIENRKPDTKTRKDNPTQQQISNNLNDAFNNNKGASETTTGTGQQGDPNGSINGRGVLGGGVNAGTGGGSGSGMYLGGGTGTGTGVGSGSGSGMSWSLSGRTMKSTPKVSGTAPDEGTVTVDIWVDANGNVTKAVANAAKSNTSNGTLFKMAEEAARKAKFDGSPSGNEQKGSIKITFKLN